MKFYLNPTIQESKSLLDFFAEWNVGEGDLIITNKFLLDAALNGQSCPCDALYQEEYGAGEPSSDMIDAMLETADKKDYHRIIAMGGGTVIDCSKLFVFGQGYRCNSILEKGMELPHMRKLIVIPTTCGTGSEVTAVSVVEFKEKHAKISLRLPAVYTDEVVLIPNLLNGLPFSVFATSSIDALIHAFESYISPIANVFNRAMGRSAIELILNGYKKLANGEKNKLPAEEDMKNFLYAATLAGIAFESGRCGPVHALSAPISFQFHFPHGKANYTVFKGVYDAFKAKGADLTVLTTVLAEILECPEEQALEQTFQLLEQVYPNIEPGSLGVSDELCREMAKTTLETQTFLVNNAPVTFTEDEIVEIYRNCL